MASERTRALYERAQRVLPGGVSRNSALRKPVPVYAARGEGCWVTDIEGVRRLDATGNMGSLIHGHAHPAIVEAVSRQLALGSAFALCTEAEVAFAEAMVARAPSFERIRFVNSGSEAVMVALKAARAFTGRPRVAKVEGAYHGVYDFAEVSQTAAPANWGTPERPASVPVCRGTPRSVLDDVIVLPFNNPAGALALLDEHGADLACVLLDPMPHRVGLEPAHPAFVQALADWCRKHASLLVFDEVITFRSGFGGAQEWYPARPDLTAMGKIIGGGFPVGAVAGRADVMDVFNPLTSPTRLPHSGTFSANPITMTAGLTAMSLFDRPAVARLNALGDLARRRIAGVIARAGIPACVTGAGSIFRVHFKARPPQNYREAYPAASEKAALDALVAFALDHGVLLVDTGAGMLCTPMGEPEIEIIVNIIEQGLHAAAPHLEAAPAAGT
ncbi:MAG: aspartate aminotransferase family protein [Phycisphaerales bacterium]|nr:aspartate aminotransferase family protein [Phycisphaerales bacterium]